MKLWKKVVAVVLAAVMSLTLLTACSGGNSNAGVGDVGVGGGSGGNIVDDSKLHDTEKEKQVTKWIQEYAKNAAGIDLVEDEDAVKASVEVQYKAIKYLKMQAVNPYDPNLPKARYDMSVVVDETLSRKGKAGMPVALSFNAEVTKSGMEQMMKAYGEKIWGEFISAGITPSLLGVVVRPVDENNVVYVIVTIAGIRPTGK